MALKIIQVYEIWLRAHLYTAMIFVAPIDKSNKPVYLVNLHMVAA